MENYQCRPFTAIGNKRNQLSSVSTPPEFYLIFLGFTHFFVTHVVRGLKFHLLSLVFSE